ncbi:MAG TPA: hypothetical protein VHJ38_00170 [Nitrososphaeraceae archaeon]|jgi:hypothetical protein|nr:hypothetical protein [Nitrososphaeraceae archaeon]
MKIISKRKCSKCLLSGFFDDPIFVGIEKVFARIIINNNQCNNNNSSNNNNNTDLITYPCKIMNIFKCPFDDSNTADYPYAKEELFALQRIAFVIELAISGIIETTRDHELSL